VLIARAWLYCIGQADAPLAAVIEKAFEAVLILWRGYDEYVPNSGQHEDGEGVVDHGFVVHRQQLFGDASGDWVQTGARASGEDDAFHFYSSETIRLSCHGRTRKILNEKILHSEG